MKKYEDEIKEVYDNLSKKYHKITAHHFFNTYLEVPETLSLLKNIRGKKVLDLGCGTGRHTKILKKRGAKVWGIDISPRMLEIAKREIKGVDFKVGSVYKLPYKPKFFDIVFAGLCVSYFENLDKAFKEINRVLKRNGIFVFSFGHPLINVTSYIKGKPRNYRKIGDYFKEEKTYANWPVFKIKMPYYHKTFQTIIKTIIRNNFVIEEYLEERPVKASKKLYPKKYKTFSKMPSFCAFKVRKK